MKNQIIAIVSALFLSLTGVSMAPDQTGDATIWETYELPMNKWPRVKDIWISLNGHIISHRMENRITGLLTGNAKVDSNTNTNTSGCPAPDIHLNDNDYDSTTTGVVGQNCTDYEGFGNRSIVSGSAVYAVYEVTSGGQENQLHYFACYSGDGACGYFNGSIASTSKLKVEGWSSMSGWLVVETDTF